MLTPLALLGGRTFVHFVATLCEIGNTTFDTSPDPHVIHVHAPTSQCPGAISKVGPEDSLQHSVGGISSEAPRQEEGHCRSSTLPLMRSELKRWSPVSRNVSSHFGLSLWALPLGSPFGLLSFDFVCLSRSADHALVVATAKTPGRKPNTAPQHETTPGHLPVPKLNLASPTAPAASSNAAVPGKQTTIAAKCTSLSPRLGVLS